MARRRARELGPAVPQWLTISETYRMDEKLGRDAEKLVPGESPRLGKLMDPSNPTGFLEGKGYRFVGWEGALKSEAPVVNVTVARPTTLIAGYRRV